MTLQETLDNFVREHDTPPHARSRQYFTTDVLYKETQERGRAQKGIFLLKHFSEMAKGSTPPVRGILGLLEETEDGCPGLKALGQEYSIEDMVPPVIQSAIDALTFYKGDAIKKLSAMLPRGFDRNAQDRGAWYDG